MTEVAAAEEELTEIAWVKRKLDYIKRQEEDPDLPDLPDGTLDAVAEAMDRWGEETFTDADDYGWGMIMGKLSAVRWVLGSEWDELDT